MKKDLTPVELLQSQFTYISAAYRRSPERRNGVLQLSLRHAGESVSCCFVADGSEIRLEFGEHAEPDCTLWASLYDWFALSADKLHPVWGVISGRLKFRGNTRLFGEIIPKSALYDIESEPYTPPESARSRSKARRSTPNRIVVINGAPRGREGFTYYYLSKLVHGMQSGPAQVEMLTISEHDIKPCLGCYCCWKTCEGRCVQRDDVTDLYRTVDEADLVVHAFPLYVDGVPGLLKDFIDRGIYRMHPYMVEGHGRTRHPRRVAREQRVFVFGICGFPERVHFDAVRRYYRQLSHNIDVPLAGEIYRTACMYLYGSPSQYKRLAAVSRALAEAGAALAGTGRVPRRLVRTIEQDVDRRAFQQEASKFWDTVHLGRESEVAKV